MTAAAQQPELWPDITLDEAKQWLRDRVDGGARCPCCGQLAKIYKRRINSQMARALIALYREAGTEWAHLRTVVGEFRADEAKLTYWGLIEENTELREDGGRAGWWRITDAGMDYLLGKAVPRYARVYDGRCLGFEGEMLTIRDAIGSKFDYDALMRGDA